MHQSIHKRKTLIEGIRFHQALTPRRLLFQHCGSCSSSAPMMTTRATGIPPWRLVSKNSSVATPVFASDMKGDGQEDRLCSIAILMTHCCVVRARRGHHCDFALLQLLKSFCGTECLPLPFYLLFLLKRSRLLSISAS